MKIISSKEIHDLYKKVNLSHEKVNHINTNLNTGTLYNKLASFHINSKINSNLTYFTNKTTQN